MVMAKFNVDSGAKLFIAKPGVTSFDVKIDLYSDAKEHWLAGGQIMGFDFPIRAVAGDLRSDASVVEPFYFLRDGWKLRPQEANHSLNVSGNIELDEGETGNLFVPTLGGFTVLVAINTTNRGSLLSGSTWSSAELEQIRHRLGIDGTASAPAAVPSLARPGDSMSLTAGERLALAAEVLCEDIGPLQASAHVHSLLSAVLKLVSRFDAKTGRTYRLDGIQTHMTQAPLVDATMKPIRQLDVSV